MKSMVNDIIYLHFIRRNAFMKKSKTSVSKLAASCVSLLGMALFVCANTASTGVVHQPKAPDGLKRFSKLK